MRKKEGEKERAKESKRTKQQEDKVIGLIRRECGRVAFLSVSTVLSYRSSCQNREGVNDTGRGDQEEQEKDYHWTSRRKQMGA